MSGHLRLSVATSHSALPARSASGLNSTSTLTLTAWSSSPPRLHVARKLDVSMLDPYAKERECLLIPSKEMQVLASLKPCRKKETIAELKIGSNGVL